MTLTTHFITFKHPEGGVGCHALCFLSPNKITRHWEFIAQHDVLEAIQHAIDGYPTAYSVRVSDLSFLEPRLFTSLFRNLSTSDGLFRIVCLASIPLREWLSHQGTYLTSVSPAYTLAEKTNNGVWRLDYSCLTDKLPSCTQSREDQYWVEISHRGVRKLA